MNYIDISVPSVENFYINVNLDTFTAVNGLIEWEVYEDGNDTKLVSFNNEFGLAQVTDLGYCLRVGIDTAAFNGLLKNNHTYNLVGFYQVHTIYRGKFEVTDQSIFDYSVNRDKFYPRIENNNFTILD